MTYVTKAVLLYFFVFTSTCEAQGFYKDYQVPTPTVEALYPEGFRVTLKDDGYTLFGFRGNINKEFQSLSEGQIKKDVVRSKGGSWVYKNSSTKLEIGDTIYYWVMVIKNGKVYMNTDLEYKVTGFVNEDGTPAASQTTPKPSDTTTTTTTKTTTSDSNIFFDMDVRFNPTMGCTISKTMVQGSSAICKDALIFNEEFDGASLRDLKKWDALIQFPLEPDYPFNVYIPDNTLSYEDGSIVITPVLTEAQRGEGFLHQTLDLDGRCTGQVGTTECKQEASGAQILPPVTTAKISTKNYFNFLYGRIEVRAKLPSGSWLLPEINLESSSNAYGPHNYESGLMRIAFVRGNTGLAKKLYGGPVLTDTEPFRSMLLKEKIGIDNWYKDFHNYTMIWRPDGMDLLVDGEQYGTVNPGGGFFESARKNNVAHASHWQKGTVMAPLDQMFHLTLGLRVGGVNDFNDDVEGKPWKNSARKGMLEFWRSKDTWFPTWYTAALKVDYVRVYAL